MKTLIAFLLLTTFLHSEDWTINSKTYLNVKVTKVEPDQVHILFDGGIGAIKMVDMPSDLQKRFNYDPTAAKAAADAKELARNKAIAEMQKESAQTNSAQGYTYLVTLPVKPIPTAGAVSGGIDNDVLNPSATPPMMYHNEGSRAARIAFLKSDIAEKEKIMMKDSIQGLRSGHPIHQEAYQRIVDDEKTELQSLLK
jgi:hypothetical protein